MFRWNLPRKKERALVFDSQVPGVDPLYGYYRLAPPFAWNLPSDLNKDEITTACLWGVGGDLYAHLCQARRVPLDTTQSQRDDGESVTRPPSPIHNILGPSVWGSMSCLIFTIESPDLEPPAQGFSSFHGFYKHSEPPNSQRQKSQHATWYKCNGVHLYNGVIERFFSSHFLRNE